MSLAFSMVPTDFLTQMRKISFRSPYSVSGNYSAYCVYGVGNVGGTIGVDWDSCGNSFTFPS